MMTKRIWGIGIAFLASFIFHVSPLTAGVTTYTFTSSTWASKVGATVCDRVTDGWICNQAASDYSAGRQYPDGTWHMGGASVKTGSSGAGATSVLQFEEVRRITFNFCQNASDGRGVIYVQVGDNAPDSIRINKPAQSGTGDLNRDSTISLSTPQSGQIRFWVTCTRNAINLLSVSIRSASGGSSVFTMDTYQLVTDVNQLQDSDQVIFGVGQDGINYIMGYYDENESVNNIHAIKGRYSSDRMQVDPDERAIYTLRTADLNGHSCYIFQDELRYEEAYLVASGGRTKNRLALWTDVVDENTYGNYGYWDITIENGGEAVITNLGNSLAKIIQYNASNSPTLFACYQDRSQTPVCLYRRVEAMGDVAAIVAPMVNFGTTLETSGSRTIQINANRLTQDIAVTHTNPSVFTLSAEVMDRDGDELTISYNVSEAGHYTDTLTFSAGEITATAIVLLHLERTKSVSEAVQSADHAMVYLNDVVVTKKYDNYIYVRDLTGSMLLFDRGDGATGKRYGADLKAGDPLSGVVGRFINYFGVPEISPTAQFRVGTNGEVMPEQAAAQIDSADVCRYLVLDSAVVNGWTELNYKGMNYAVENKFHLSAFVTSVPTRAFVIVSYDHDVVTLYIVKQETYPSTPSGGETSAKNQPAFRNRLILRDGVLIVESGQGCFTLQGEKIL